MCKLRCKLHNAQIYPLEVQILQIIFFDVILWTIKAIIPHIWAQIIKTFFSKLEFLFSVLGSMESKNICKLRHKLKNAKNLPELTWSWQNKPWCTAELAGLWPSPHGGWLSVSVPRPNWILQCAALLAAGSYDRPCRPIKSLFLLSPARWLIVRATAPSPRVRVPHFGLTYTFGRGGGPKSRTKESESSLKNRRNSPIGPKLLLSLRL